MCESILCLVLVLYLLSMVGYLAFLIALKRPLALAATGLLAAGAVCHLLWFFVRYYEAGYPPLTNNHEVVSLFALGLAWVCLLVLWRWRHYVIGAFISPLLLIFTIYAAYLPGEIAPILPILKSPWLPVHVILALLGFVMLGLTFCAGVMYLIMERQVKVRRLGGLFHRLPSLQSLDEISYLGLAVGFPLLTLAMITGAVWAQSTWGSFWSWEPKQIWSLVTWFFYAALLHGRLAAGWRGRRAAWFALVGFVVLLFAFLGVNLLMGGGEHVELLKRV